VAHLVGTLNYFVAECFSVVGITVIYTTDLEIIFGAGKKNFLRSRQGDPAWINNLCTVKRLLQ